MNTLIQNYNIVLPKCDSFTIGIDPKLAQEKIKRSILMRY